MSDGKTRILRASEYATDKLSYVTLTQVEPANDFTPVQLGRTPWPSDDELAQVREQAIQEGYEIGKKLARKELQTHLRQRGEELENLLRGLTEPYADLNDAVAREIAVLALNVGSALFRRAIDMEPEQVLHIVRSAVAALPSSKRKVTIVLHPEDLDLCAQMLSLEETDFELKPDPSLRRGGCKVMAGAAVVDATLNKRLQSIAEAMLDQADKESDDAAD
ncbi:MAG: FliH/SctL family protein [Xanthomonadales bacterium]|nr:FliH/SctL family protein [Xanthomonadales bacterium]